MLPWKTLNFFPISTKKLPEKNSSFGVVGQLENRFHLLLNFVILRSETSKRFLQLVSRTEGPCA
jgi:hypothetical protein